MDLSISIVNWNTKDFLKQCLKSIYENTSRVDFEIFVVDNGSRDGSKEMVKEEFPNLCLIENKENLGFAKANNQVIKKAKGKYFLLLNSDTKILNQALDKMVDFMDKHPQAGTCGCRLLFEDKTLQPSCKRFLNLYTAFFLDTFLGSIFPKVEQRHRMSSFRYNKVEEVEQPMGSALMLRMETIKDIGLMDERFFLFFEEVDWCCRIKKKGWKIYFTPDAEIIHYQNRSFNRLGNTLTIRHWHRSKYEFLEKYYGVIPVIFLRIFVIFSSFLIMGKWMLFYISARDKSLIVQRIKTYWNLIKVSWS